VVLFTAEAEYIAATHATKEGIWLCQLISKLFNIINEPTTLYCNNQVALMLATNNNFHTHTKHINIQYHFIQETVDSGTFKLIYCSTDNMVADIFTKALPGWKVKVVMCHPVSSS